MLSRSPAFPSFSRMFIGMQWIFSAMEKYFSMSKLLTNVEIYNLHQKGLKFPEKWEKMLSFVEVKNIPIYGMCKQSTFVLKEAPPLIHSLI